MYRFQFAFCSQSVSRGLIWIEKKTAISDRLNVFFISQNTNNYNLHRHNLYNLPHILVQNHFSEFHPHTLLLRPNQRKSQKSNHNFFPARILKKPQIRLVLLPVLRQFCVSKYFSSCFPPVLLACLFVVIILSYVQYIVKRICALFFIFFHAFQFRGYYFFYKSTRLFNA